MSRQMLRSYAALFLLLAVSLSLPLTSALRADFVATDPGVRGGPPGAGGPLPGIGRLDLQLFLAGQSAFQEVDSVQGTIPDTGRGLGPRFNLDSCAGCHSQPAPGGSSPPVNPQLAVAAKEGAANVVPPFVATDGPVLDAFLRFHPDGSRDGRLLDLFTIAGRTDAPGCDISQPDLETQLANDNLGFRMPTPMFGGGLLESIADETIKENMAAEHGQKQALGIAGHPNTLPGGAIGRMGWKAEQKGIGLFVAGAYNAEIGVTSPLFRIENDRDPACHFNKTPEDRFHPGAATLPEFFPDVVNFAFFVRFLAPPAPPKLKGASRRGPELFEKTGCAACHVPRLKTGDSDVKALAHREVAAYTDLLLHDMGPTLADICLGLASPSEFRTEPLMGLRFSEKFLHDGRAASIEEAIRLHGGEAVSARDRFDSLPAAEREALLAFLKQL